MNTDVTSLSRELKIMGDEKRFLIVRLLLTYDLCVEALAQRLDISKSAVSQHLKILRDAGLVRGEKRGYFTHYCVDRERIQQIAARLSDMAEIKKLHCKPGPLCCGDGRKED